MKNVSDNSCGENKIHNLCSITFSLKSCRLWDNVEKCCRARQATWQYGACTFHAGYLRLQTHTQNI